ncbi:hypothetical protein VT84_13785 [Gemmata sp. SH-PL17]|uniref:hypothetical protein n=1 Tax=Gemmata sp. SH-PL17 TaxID=1630693 RepID=UPI00078DCDF2|nr:hypothetical protein [Gemmata sp. SH-PL17]AMV25464.1 hypothetical protein VT84_13785 [Gemmata sp. SH-PL17]
MTYLVRVTAEHIAEGVRGSCGSCPIALAIHDAIEDEYGSPLPAFTVFVSPSNTVFINRRPYPLREEVVAAAMKFDRTGEMEPFEFTLELS